MPIYEAQLSDGTVAQVESDHEPTESEILSAVSSEPRGEKTSVLGAAARAAGTSVAPGAAFVAGFGPGAATGAEIGAFGGPLDWLTIPAGGAIGGLITGGAAAWAADKAQRALLKSASPKTAARLEELQQADVEQHPVASTIGDIAGMLPSAELAPLKAASLPFRAALGAGVGAVQPLVTQGRLPTKRELATGAAMGALFGKGRFGGKTEAISPESEESGPAAATEPSPVEVEYQKAIAAIDRIAGQPRPSPKVPASYNLPTVAEWQDIISGKEVAPKPEAPTTKTTAAPIEETLTPALKFGNQTLEGGKNHGEVMNNNLGNVEDPVALMKSFEKDDTHVFQHRKPDGSVETLTREEAGPIYDRLWGNEPGTTKSVESKMLLEPKQPKPAAPPSPPAAPTPPAETAPAAAPVPEPALTGQQGGGAAAVGEVSSGAAEDIMGVRQKKTRGPMGAAGQPVVATPNEGVNLEESLADGRARLARDPAAADRAASELEEGGKVSAPGFNVARAKYEQVMAQGRQIASKFGTMSPEYHAARMEAFKWSDITKRMQTEWHKLGMGQQGETDIDTGELLDLENDYHSKTGKDMTPDQRQRGKGVASINKKAQQATADAQEKFNQHLVAKTTGMTSAERAAQDAVWKVLRDWAVRRANAENKARVANEVYKQALAKIQEDAAAKAEAARTDVARANAVREANAENKARVDAAKRAKDLADIEVKRVQQAHNAVTERARKAAIASAKQARKLQDDPTLRVWTKAKEYLDQGIDKLDDIVKKLGVDLGMTNDQVVRLLAQDKRAKYLADDLWRKQQRERNLKSNAKRWVQSLSTPGYIKALQNIPRIMFGLKVGFHGTVALGTHAPAVAFQPRFWSAYVRDFGKMYRMIGNKAYYENQVQDLMRRDNYTTARRAGLVNDPFVYEDYNSPDTAKYFGNLTGMGNRGYSVLKILRQDMFDQHWNQLPKSAQIPEMAQAIADGVNHATGVVKGRAPPGTNLALFAPRLEASRVMWLAGDPLKAAGTLLNWKNASMGDKHFAMNQIKEKAWVVGTLGSLLALNQGVLSATGSKQKVNVTDPFSSDFLKFKAAGMDVSYGNPLITMARLPLRLFVGIENEGKLNKIVYEDENVATVLFEYVRSQMSPFAGTATDLALGRNYMRRPLPRAAFGLLPGKTNLPKRLRAEGIKPFTWTEYATQQAAMIPLQEALKEVWGKDLFMDAAARQRAAKALATITVMMGTGARVSDDYSLKPKQSQPIAITK